MTAKPLFHQQLESSPCTLFQDLPQSHREREDKGESEISLVDRWSFQAWAIVVKGLGAECSYGIWRMVS